VLRCGDCGYVFADTSLTDEELTELYREEFFTGGAFSDYPSDEKYFRKNFRARFKTLSAFLDDSRHRHLLEIGSAYGFFLDEVRERFESVRGIDITDGGVRYARERFGLDVIQADFLAHDFGAKKFDVVCMWDTIEHLRAPHLFVEKIAAQTEKGALLALTTGDIESVNARLRGSRWRLFIPSHLHYFSRRTIALMLDRYGFDVIYNRYCGFYRSFDNVAHNVLLLRHNSPRLYRLLQRTGLTRHGFYLNLYDAMYVIARRR
jgi:SAM-dependent methyltransferase